MKRKITLIYISSDGKDKREFLISTTLLKIIVGLISFIIVSIILSFIFISTVYYDALQKKNYENKVRYMENEIKKLEELKSDIKDLYEKNEKIRELLGIDLQNKILKSHSNDISKAKFEMAKVDADSLKEYNELKPDINPVEGVVSRSFSKDHPAIDIACDLGTMVVSTIDGKVDKTGWDQTFGNYVKIKNNKFSIFYGHLQKVLVKMGQTIKKSEIVGTVGSTGKSSAPHLHYEIMMDSVYYDPMQFVNLNN
ncbi:MAG: peptidoglycan DD-metalloendopeptidase family protein [bacterium]|uniref:Peptidase M23 n=2 Tax=Bacteria candidate phyla TaxID=1783234 RepID=A0A124G0G0_UNCT6|nr:MAG: Peptidase M23 [candidate division TA06 bacterium 32_111]KUK87401.1 MAG: Peptidase M23 [candidate division TA06 bacterium 34_109]MDI6701144.1 peptidoglycan DD-metalloendopeptidase family protein [bacterium]HAF07765.1 hypothetical protein [candidate division WOR-3 bacterium]HCP17283.1 hypothetical protein [candidate division WOR-3 bacterium]